LQGESDLDINEEFCPVCKNKNERGAIVCMHCGELLEKHRTDSILTIKNTEAPKVATAKLANLHFDESSMSEDGIAIYAEGMSKPAFLRFERDLVLGRNGLDADGMTNGGILNLSELGGYQMGISRRHALIRRTESGFEIIDLASTNGSWMNDEKLVPKKPYPLASRSQLRFGRMWLLVLFRSVPKTKVIR
jgi:hypothetical protein